MAPFLLHQNNFNKMFFILIKPLFSLSFNSILQYTLFCIFPGFNRPYKDNIKFKYRPQEAHINYITLSVIKTSAKQEAC